MSLIENLRSMELARDAYWSRYASTASIRLHWRATTVRHCFHVLPGERILELGAGTGLWTAHLAQVFRGENPITAGVFSEEFAARLEARNLPETRVQLIRDLDDDLEEESFDYVIGTGILCHDRYPENLRAINKLLRPGGSMLFFEANFWNPQVLLKSLVPSIGRRAGNARCQIGMRKYRLMHAASRAGFTQVETIPFDILHPRTPSRLIHAIKSSAFVLEHVPGLRELCGTLYIWGCKPGGERRALPSLASHPRFLDAVSVVIPCHNEERNIPRLVAALGELYGGYIKEFIIVDDNSDDGTADAVRALNARDPRVRLIRRDEDPGVGRALAVGYQAARGSYILSMDADFALIAPEMRDLFDAVADGNDGAIGSRFSHDSILVNYPVMKIIVNRLFHRVARLLLRRRFTDISNNLKLYRADILRDLVISSPDFAANAEIGLKSFLNRDIRIKEVPISWINRTDDMGHSSFGVARYGPSYLVALIRILRQRRSRRVREGSWCRSRHEPTEMASPQRDSR